MNEQGSQGQSAGSELLLGMHGFVGGQSQNSGRAPGLQHAALCPAAGDVSKVKKGGGAPRTKGFRRGRGPIRL